MTLFTRFHNLPLNLYDVIGDVTDQVKKSEITFFLKQCSRLPKYSISSITIQFNVKNKQEIQISAKPPPQNAVAMATPGPKIKILPHHQIAR